MAGRRKRGAQPRNTNALKHGLYARHLTGEQLEALLDAEEMDPADLQHEIALLRARLASVVSKAPERFDLVVAGLRTLAQLVAVRHRLSPNAAEELGGAIARVVEGVGTQLGAFDESAIL